MASAVDKMLSQAAITRALGLPLALGETLGGALEARYTALISGGSTGDSVFHDLPEPARRNLARRVRHCTVPAGGLVYEKGSRGNEMYFVLSGTAEELANDQLEATLTSGHSFGFETMYERAARAVTVRATAAAELELLSLTWPQLVAATEFYPSVMMCIANGSETTLQEYTALISGGSAGDSVFQGLPEPAKRNLARRVKRRTVPAGGLVFETGSRGNEMYFVLGGTAEVMANDQLEATLASGRSFGHETMYENLPR
jgi:CRP-like cAMP-binding protein